MEEDYQLIALTINMQKIIIKISYLPILKKHKKGFGVSTEKDFANHAIHFANTIDKMNCISFIDHLGTTHKYNVQTNSYITVDKNGYVVTYFKPTDGYDYYFRKKRIILND